MDLPFRCRCGKLRGVIEGAAPDTTHRALCYCDDCQSAAYAIGAPDFLDARGASDIFQVPPRMIRLTEGAAQLRCLRLSPKGLLRWYAGCCDTPVGNCLATPRSPFAGIHGANFELGERSRDEVLGPVRMRVMGAFARGGCPEGVAPKVRLSEAGPVARLLLRSVLRGLHRPSPFFDAATGAPVATPRVLSLAERNAARAKAGQAPL